MGLRRFHLFFIAVSVALAAFVAAWAGGQYRQLHEIRFIVTVIVCLAAGGALAVYGAKFQRRTRNL
jgi:ABC-type enterobactin transport system permease subunit